jgi:hypothetical protein
VAAGALPYRRIFRIEGASGVVISGFRRQPELSKSVTISGLKPLAGSTLAYLDSINSAAPLPSPALHVSQRRPLQIAGWAVDAPNRVLAGAVYVEIGGRVFKAVYGGSRPDVAAALHNPAYEKSGYTAEVPLDGISQGEQRLIIRVLNGQSTGYYLGPTVTLSVN